MIDGQMDATLLRKTTWVGRTLSALTINILLKQLYNRCISVLNIKGTIVVISSYPQFTGGMSKSIYPQINNNTYRTVDVVFLRFRGFQFTIGLRKKSKGVTRIRRRILRRMRVTPLGVFPRVIANENPLNLEKTRSSVISLLFLIYVSIYYVYCL